MFPSRAKKDGRINLKEKTERFVEETRSIREFADVFLVADLKDPTLLKLSTLEAALLLRERLGVDASPVIVVRDMNRQQFLSSVLAGITLGLGSMMIAWGDDYPPRAGLTNVRDFPRLAAAIRQASGVRRRARAPTTLMAPVDVEKLATAAGVALAKGRLRAGADYLLAQPPTTDADATFERHLSLLEGAGLKGRVLLNVFPFWDEKDVRASERYFGWKLPQELHRTAKREKESLLQSGREVVRRIRAESLPGVYVSTRGVPTVAETLLT